MKTRSHEAERCARAVMETVPGVMRAIRREMRREGGAALSIPQLRTLAYLSHSSGACLFEVADHLGVARPTASVIVDRLVQRGMVARTTDPKERRRALLTLTPTGERYFERARQSTQDWTAGVLSSLAPGALDRIAEALTWLRSAFSSESGAAAGPSDAMAKSPRRPAGEGDVASPAVPRKGPRAHQREVRSRH